MCTFVDFSYRCTPLHKAKVVKLVSERSFVWGDGTVTLAIGDGANDVPMIQRVRSHNIPRIITA